MSPFLSAAALRRVLLTLSLCLSCVGYGARGEALQAPQAPAVKALERGLRSLDLPPGSASLWVFDLTGDALRTAYEADVLRPPASLVKLLPVGAGLLSLGPDFRWRTEAWGDGDFTAGALEGDLLLWGEGDPFFNDEALYRFVSSLRAQGLETVQGDLLIDGSALAPTVRDRDAFDGQGDRLYNLSAHALLPNFTAATVQLYPDPAGTGVGLSLSPTLPALRVDNRLKLIDGPCVGYQRGVAINVLGAERDLVRLEGTFPKGCARYRLTRSVLTPETYLADRFRHLFESLGGRWAGQVRPGRLDLAQREAADVFDALPRKAQASTPAPPGRLLRQSSPPLDEVAWRLGKNSNNVMTTQLLLTLGRERGGEGSEAAGWQALRGVFAEAGVALSSARLSHPAGLARDDGLSAAQLGAVLKTLWHSPRMPEFLHALPIAGVDGTLARRFESAPFAGAAHLKTGTLAGVSNLAGYLLTRSGRRLAVVLLVQGEDVEHGLGPSLQEVVLNALWAD